MIWVCDLIITPWHHHDPAVAPLWHHCDPVMTPPHNHTHCDLLMTSQWDENPSSKARVCQSQTTPILICSTVRRAICHPGEGQSLQRADWSGPLWSELTSSLRFLQAHHWNGLPRPVTSTPGCEFTASSALWSHSDESCDHAHRLWGRNGASQVSHRSVCVGLFLCGCVCQVDQWENAASTFCWHCDLFTLWSARLGSFMVLMQHWGFHICFLRLFWSTGSWEQTNANRQDTCK